MEKETKGNVLALVKVPPLQVCLDSPLFLRLEETNPALDASARPLAQSSAEKLTAEVQLAQEQLSGSGSKQLHLIMRRHLVPSDACDSHLTPTAGRQRNLFIGQLNGSQVLPKR